MTEKQIAIMEGELCNKSDGYFGARDIMFDTTHNRKVFEAGFVRAYEDKPTIDMIYLTERLKEIHRVGEKNGGSIGSGDIAKELLDYIKKNRAKAEKK